jgi:DNA-binding SARP family transcriptional activator
MPVCYSLQLLGAPKFAAADGTERHLPSRRALGLLVCLAIEGRVTRAKLAALFWGEVDDGSARRNLRRELARLRDAGLGDTFEASDDTLRLGASVETDLAGFVAACERDDTDAALACWRGALLDGFGLADAPAFDAWLAEQREALARRWRLAASAAAARCEAQGDARGALAWHLQLSADDPLQELHHANAMRLHHLLGERAAALEVFERCRALLRDELGLEPLAATVALAERIRAAEHLAPLVARRADAALRRLDAPLIGRDAEAARLRERRSAVLLLQGEPGVGKTRLAQECLLARITVSMRCEAIAREAALHPVAEAMRAAFDRPDRRERLATLAPADRHEAARLLPALDPAARFDAAGGAPGTAERQRFFDALGELLDRLAGPGGTLWIDDLHWADDTTLALVAHLAHRCGRDPAAHVRVVAAARTQELEQHAAARGTLRALERARLLERVPLAAFAEADTLALVRALSGTAGGARFAARLQRATHGNPFFLLETVRFLFDAGELQLDERGAWTTRYDDATADYAELPVPPTLTATVIERVERLGAAARRVLEAAALTSAGFTLAQVQPATALSEWEALDGLERAVQAELLAEFAPGWRFVHELAREALAGQLGADRRRLIHERLARTLIAQGGRADRIALHLEGALHAAEALPWRLAAAQEARRVFAWREALDHLAQALRGSPDAAQRRTILRERVELARLLYDLATMDDALGELDALADGTRDEALKVEVLGWRAEQAHLRKRPQDALEPASAAIALPAFARAPRELRLRARLALGTALLAARRIDDADRALEAASADADASAASPLERALLLRGLANAARMREDFVRAEPLLTEAIGLLGDPSQLAWMFHRS